MWERHEIVEGLLNIYTYLSYPGARASTMAQFEDICALGGADAPFEQILEYVGGRIPGGEPGTMAERTWQRMRSWIVTSRAFFLAWREYQREA